MVVTTRREQQIPAVRVPDVQDESYGATQIGPFDYVPKVGFREYWYPCVWTKEVGRKPKNIKMLGDELVLFRGKNGKIVALNEWCPHRGARLSRGFCEFEGTVTCPYHGYTFDETGNCVAGLIESTESPLVNKMRTRVYPTAEWNGHRPGLDGRDRPRSLRRGPPLTNSPTRPSQDVNTPGSRCGKPTGPSP